MWPLVFALLNSDHGTLLFDVEHSVWSLIVRFFFSDSAKDSCYLYSGRTHCCSNSCSYILQFYGIAGVVCTGKRYVN